MPIEIQSGATEKSYFYSGALNVIFLKINF